MFHNTSDFLERRATNYKRNQVCQTHFDSSGGNKVHHNRSDIEMTSVATSCGGQSSSAKAQDTVHGWLFEKCHLKVKKSYWTELVETLMETHFLPNG